MKSVLLFLLASRVIAATFTKPAQFVDRRDYGPGATKVRVVDVNRDKIPDLLEINEFSNGAVTTLLGNGNGLFHAGPISQIGLQGLAGLAALDLNGDGKVDLVVSAFVSANLTGPAGLGVSFGNGDGTFQPAVFYQINDPYVGDLLMGDFNGDGIPDAVIRGYNGLWLFTGQGGGVFNPGVMIPAPGGVLGHIAAADFNGDGHLDLVATFDSNTSGFVLLLGNGNGTFQAPVTFNIPPGGENHIAVGDLNHDGHPDIVLSPSGANVNYVNVLLNNGAGGFLKPIQANMNGAVPITIGDVNRDGIPDLVNSLGTVALGEGDGKFRPPVNYPVENSLSSYDVVLAELHRKGVLDIVAAQSQAVSVLLNYGNGKFEESEWLSVPGSRSCAAAADFNGDGRPDLAVPTSTGIVILLGTGKPGTPYTTGATIPLSGPGCPRRPGRGKPSWQQQASSRIFARSSPNGRRGEPSLIPLSPKVHLLGHDSTAEGDIFWSGPPVRSRTPQGRFPPARLLHPGGRCGMVRHEVTILNLEGLEAELSSVI